jgi:hypothetical protein
MISSPTRTVFKALTMLTLVLGSISATSAAAADEIVKPGSSYSAARKLLLSKGYAPIQFPKYRCLENVSGRTSICEAYPETTFCSGTRLANCQFVLRGPKGELLLIETEGEEQATAGHDIGFDLGVKRARLATSDERAQLLADALDKTQDSSEAQSTGRIAALRLYLIWDDNGEMSKDLSQQKQVLATSRRHASIQARVDIVLEGHKGAVGNDPLRVSVHSQNFNGETQDTTYKLPVGYFVDNRMFRSIIVTHDCMPFEVNATLGQSQRTLKVDLTCGD